MESIQENPLNVGLLRVVNGFSQDALCLYCSVDAWNSSLWFKGKTALLGFCKFTSFPASPKHSEEPSHMGSGLVNAPLYSLLDSEVYLPQKQMETSEHMNARKADFWTNFILSCVLQGSCLKCVSCSSSHQGHILLLTWLMYLWVDLDSLPLSPEGDVSRPF